MLRALAKKAYYFGFKHRCPVCNSQTRSMRTFSYQFDILSELDVIGGEYIPDDTCPMCFSGSRERLLYYYLDGSGLVSANARILNVAPERGIYERLMKPIRGYVAIDIEPERYDYIQGIQLGNLMDLNFATASFDLVLCNHVLEHVPDDRKAMSEIARVLAPGGRAILQVPMSQKLEATIEDPTVTDPRERERRFGQFDHIRIYAADYFSRLADAGLAVDFVAAADVVRPLTAQAAKVNPRETLFVARHAG